MEDFVVKHYSEDEAPTLKGNGFDGIRVGEDREEAQRLADYINALRKDAERYRFERENRFQWFEPTRHWRLTTATGKTVHEGAADTYDEAVDAAMAASGSIGAA